MRIDLFWERVRPCSISMAHRVRTVFTGPGCSCVTSDARAAVCTAQACGYWRGGNAATTLCSEALSTGCEYVTYADHVVGGLLQNCGQPQQGCKRNMVVRRCKRAVSLGKNSYSIQSMLSSDQVADQIKLQGRVEWRGLPMRRPRELLSSGHFSVAHDRQVSKAR